MADPLTKHRLDAENYTLQFGANVLESGESLSSIDRLDIVDSSGTVVSSEFGSPTGTINGSDVDFTLGVASSGDQDAALYSILCVVITDTPRTLVAKDPDDVNQLPRLQVSEEGDPNAP